jgi:hypothetical protein
MVERQVWSETVHDPAGRWQGAVLIQRADGRLLLGVGDRWSVLDDDDARSLFAALGEALRGRGADS